MSSQDEQNILDTVPFKQGAIAGAASFLVGYIVTLVIVALTEGGEDLIELSGLAYYNAQFADAELTFTGGSEGLETAFSGTTLNFVTGSSSFGSGEELFALKAPAIVYHLIPVVALILSGFLLARYISVQTTQEGALAGGAVAVGTLPLSLLGVFIFTFTEESTETAPILSDSLLFVGILFPLILGAIGGALSTRV